MSTKVIWSAYDDISYLKGLPEDEKRDELVDTYGFDEEDLADMSNEELDELIDAQEQQYQEMDDDEMEADTTELEEEIIPKINAQTRDGVIFFYSDDEKYADYAEHLAEAKDGLFFTELADTGNGIIARRNDGKEFKLFAFPESDTELISVFEATLANFIDSLCADEPELRDEVLQNMELEGDLTEMYSDKTNGDFDRIPEVLKPVNLHVNESLNEATAKNPEGLQAELDEIKPLADEYGFEYFTSMPLINFDNDTTSIEYNYPNFFKIIKAFFKELDILADPDDMDELEDNWYTFSQVDWDTCMKVAEKCLASGKSQQVEKVYKDVVKTEEGDIVKESLKEGLGISAEEFKKRILAKFGGKEESLKEGINISADEFKKRILAKFGGMNENCKKLDESAA